jgi:hypothetical protein
MNPFIKKILMIAGGVILAYILFTAGMKMFTDVDRTEEPSNSQAESSSDSAVVEGDIFTKKENLDFNSLKVKVIFGEFNYISGDNEKNGYDIYWNEKVFTEKITIDAYKDRDKLVVETDPNNLVGVVNIKNKNEDLKNQNKITVFKDGQALDEAEIEFGLGVFNLENLKTKELKLKSGVGKLKVDGLVISDEAKFETGVGAVNIQNAIIQDLDLEAGVGDIIIEGVLTGETEVKSGMGQVTLKIHGNMEDYRFDIDKGVGTVKINGERYENIALPDNGPHVIKIESGVGVVSIEFVN